MTAQVPEKIIIDGQLARLYTLPLQPFEPVLDARRERGFRPTSTACWRRYIGTWEIREDRLYLIKLDCYFQREVGQLEKIFPGVSPPVFAYWYTGTLRIPQGELLEYVHGGFASTYEKDLLLTISRGVLLSKVVHDNAEQGVEVYANGVAFVAAGPVRRIFKMIRRFLGT